MSMLQKIRNGLRKFMAGRRGPDELSMALLVAGVLLSVIGRFFRFGLLELVGLIGYFLALFRVLSRNVEKRYNENVKFLNLWRNWRPAVSQFFNRIRNITKYKYFKCPECKSRLRLPRKVGEVTVTCGKCHHAFKQKA